MSRVYFIGSARSKAVKIGVAEDPRTRLSALQTGNSQRLVLLAEMPGDERYERVLHRTFAPQRIRGEWFKNEGALAELIKSLPIMPSARAEESAKYRQTIAERQARAVAVASHAKAEGELHRDGNRRALYDAIHIIGIEEFAALAGTHRNDVARALNGAPGRRFPIDWLLLLLAVLPRDQATSLAERYMALIGFGFDRDELRIVEENKR